MIVEQTPMDEVIVIVPDLFEDPRGYFMESYRADGYKKQGIFCDFVQDNISYSSQNTLRGLHYQHPHGQAKLVSVVKGEVYDVAVDVRSGSPTFGQWLGVHLSADNRRQLFIPAGFAHGYCVLSDTAIFTYKCSDYYAPQAEHGVLWNDPQLGIDWPVNDPLLSEKDGAYPLLRQIDETNLPEYLPHG